MRRARTPTPIADALAGRDEVTVLVRGQMVSGLGLHRPGGYPMTTNSEIDRSALTALIEQAVERALQRALAARPVPTQVTLKQAAEMLGVSTATARKLGMRRSKTGLIPYEEVLEKRKVW
jgi:hypothetical protein